MRPTASNSARLDERNLLRQVRRARSRLLGLRIAIVRRPTFQDVGDVYLRARQADGTQHRIQAAGRPARRTARPADPRRRPALRRSRTGARRAGRRRTPFACGSCAAHSACSRGLSPQARTKRRHRAAPCSAPHAVRSALRPAPRPAWASRPRRQSASCQTGMPISAR